LKLNNDVLKHTVVQINEMQSAMREAAKQIEGSQEYIAKQMEIFKENENLKNLQKILKKQREQVANSFFANNQTMQSAAEEIKRIQRPQFKIDASTMRMIDDAVKIVQEIEGYPTEVSKQMQDEIKKLQKLHSAKVSPSKDGNDS